MKTKEQRQAEQKERLDARRLWQTGQLSAEDAGVTIISGNVDDSYKLADFEAGHYHVKLTKRIHYPAQQRYQNFEQINKFTPVMYKRLAGSDTAGESFFTKNFYKVELLHDPEKQEIEQAKAKATGRRGRKAADN